MSHSFLIVAFLICPILADEFPIPPSLWCDDNSLAKKVGVYDQCKAYNASALGKKIKVTLLYETLCPDCQQLIKNVLYPQVWQQGQNLVDLELVPYGNARHNVGANGTYEITCQHGPTECKLNKLHSCVIDQLADPSRWFPFIYCMEVAIEGGEDPDNATKNCYTQQRIKSDEQKKIRECTSGARGDQLQTEAADKTDKIKPDSHTFVPWILINNISLAKAQIYQNILFPAVCSWYRADKVPPECQFFGNRRSNCQN